MEELIAAARAIDAYAGIASDCEPVGTIGVLIKDIARLHRALAAVSDYNEHGTHQCMGCDEPVSAPGIWCSRCKQQRPARRNRTAPWECEV